jgi:2-dehydro-3-deoxyphosphooctonate aldolase (KDO 8-P synthase)
MAERLKEISEKQGIGFVFKASFDKANRSSLSGDRGLGMDAGLKLFRKIKETFGLSLITDVHESYQCNPVGDVVDIIQIPALLCRQTDLIVAASATGKIVNIKKGQFLSPSEMKNVVVKAKSGGNNNILICERGTLFGYQNLVNDMKGIPVMAGFGCPIIFDGTHSVQSPGSLGGKSGGDRTLVESLCRAAVGIGVAGLFIETHINPEESLSDGPNMIPISDLEQFIKNIQKIDAISKNTPYLEMSKSPFTA